MAQERVSLMYRMVMAIATPIVVWWGRLKVEGLDKLPASGPTMLMCNHDSAWDPVIVGVAAKRRQIRALAKSSLWKSRPLGWVLDHMGQIPIDRGRGDVAALSAAIEHLERGRCIGVFPEGTVSRGRKLRAQSGAGRLTLAVPGTYVLGVRIHGATDVVRFPKRPRLRVEFIEPAGGQPRPDETAAGLTKRIMAEIRAEAPHAVSGRRRKAEHLGRLAAEYNAGKRPAVKADIPKDDAASQH